jgi:hypothetical protein
MQSIINGSTATDRKEEGIEMNTSTTTILDLGGFDDSCFFAAPIDLDYDEPNAVVEQDTVEFVSPAASAITAVELPVVTVIDEPRKPATVATPALRRTAA